MLLSLLALCNCVKHTMVGANTHSDDSSTLVDFGLLSDVSVALGSVLGLISIGALRQSRILSNCNALLISYAYREEFFTRWAYLSCWDLVAAISIWICAVFERMRGVGVLTAVTGERSLNTQAVLSLVAFIFCSGVLLGLAFTVVHICRALNCMIDAFCCRVVDQHCLAEAVRDWNVLQAMLRRACGAVEWCLFVLQATIISMILLIIADVVISGSEQFSLLALLPATIVMLGITRIFFNAAAVTEKCTRVPALVNSLHFGKDFDQERQYVVEYIIHSAAGFYVFEVRLTSYMALKFLYVSCVCAFAVATKVVSEK